MSPYRVAIIGCGRIASLLEQEEWRGHPCTHAGCFDYCPRTTIVAASDAVAERREAFGRRWGVERLYADAETMLAREEAEIVCIATYPIPHRDLTLTAVAAGAKAIFCEKAMATSLREADEMIAAGAAVGVRLTINHGRRWDWQYRQVGRLLREGRIGALRAMALHGACGLANNGTHYFDMLRYFAGDVAWAVGRLADPEALDPRGSGYFHFASGVECTVNLATAGRAAHLFELIGERGRIVVANNRPPRFRVFVDADGVMAEQPFPQTPAEEVVNTFGAGRCVLPRAVEEIVASLDRGEPTCSTGEDGRTALEMVLALHESHALGNVRVGFPLSNRDRRVLVRDADFVSSAQPAAG